MPEGVDATSFEFNEGIRIIIPGAVTVALVDGIVRTADDESKGLGLGTFSAVVAAVLIGLLFYFVDAPAKATVYSHEQPTDTLRSWKEGTKDQVGTLNAYFVMLDKDVPPGIKVRATYMGSMYRIGYESIYLLVVASALVLGQTYWTWRSVDVSRSGVPAAVWISMAVGVAMTAFAWYANRVTQARRKQDQRAPTGPALRDYDLVVVGLAAVLLVVVLVTSCWWDLARWVLLIPTTTVLLLWGYRYFKGYATTSEDRLLVRAKSFVSAWRASGYKKVPPVRVPVRRATSAFRATRLVVASNILLGLAYLGAPRYDSWLDRTELSMWLLIQATGVVLVIARGHERRLKGAYATQRTWMTLNKAKILEDYFRVPDPPDEDSEDATPTRPASPPEQPI